MEGLQLLAPVLHPGLAQKVWKVCRSRPYLQADINLATTVTQTAQQLWTHSCIAEDIWQQG